MRNFIIIIIIIIIIMYYVVFSYFFPNTLIENFQHETIAFWHKKIQSRVAKIF